MEDDGEKGRGTTAAAVVSTEHAGDLGWEGDTGTEAGNSGGWHRNSSLRVLESVMGPGSERSGDKRRSRWLESRVSVSDGENDLDTNYVNYRGRVEC